MNDSNFVLLVGAGASLSDAMRLSVKQQPPLDKGFFANALYGKSSELGIVRKYLKNAYQFDPIQENGDSLESVMAMIYADIHNPDLASDAVPAFRALIRLINSRIAETTNRLLPTRMSNLYRLLSRVLDGGYSPKRINIITFNQDLQIEKTLSKIESTGRGKRVGGVFSFPFCYELPRADTRITETKSQTPKFTVGKASDQTIKILKLHGSLNWYSIHHTRDITKNAILNSVRKYRITRRSLLTSNLTFTGKRTMYGFPLIVPPVTHKAGILHEEIQPLWTKASNALENANEIVVFGYSCPVMDFESANLIRRSLRQNGGLQKFSIIDPDPHIFERYVDLTNLGRLRWYKSMDNYLR